MSQREVLELYEPSKEALQMYKSGKLSEYLMKFKEVTVDLKESAQFKEIPEDS